MSHNNVWRKEWKIENMVDGLLMHDNDLTIVTNVIKKIINESPIKPTFTEDIIVEKFLNAQKIRLRTGFYRTYLLFLCAFHDMLSDEEAIRIICKKFGIPDIILYQISHDYPDLRMNDDTILDIEQYIFDIEI